MGPQSRVFETAFYIILSLCGICFFWISFYFYADIGQKSGDTLSTIIFFTSLLFLLEAYCSSPKPPEKIVTGYFLAATLGVSLRIFGFHVGIPQTILTAISVGASIFIMNFTGSSHTSGGACAAFAIIGGKEIESLGYSYILLSIGIGFSLTALIQIRELCSG